MANILREDENYHTFCGLTCVGWLYQKMQDSFFLILGTHTCSHLLQVSLGVMVFARPRFAVIQLEEEDLASNTPDILPMVQGIINEHQPSIIFLLNSCTPEIIHVDIENTAQRLDERLPIPVVPVHADGLEYTAQQAEDSVLQALLRFCPVLPEGERNVVFLGSVGAGSAEWLVAEAKSAGIPLAGFIPAPRLNELPAIGPGTVVGILQPYLQKTAAKIARERGATVVTTQFPIGPDGSRAFYEAIAAAWGTPVNLAAEEALAWARIEKHLVDLRGKRIFMMGDSMLELPLARFLTHAGAQVLEVGTPYVNRRSHKPELDALMDIPIVERPNMRRQIDDIRRLRPDLVIANFHAANPLESEGIPTKWSMEFSFTQLHGFGGAGELAGLYTRALRRHALLDELSELMPLPIAD